jgi:RND family efflux transporter MFP subunit
MLRRGLLLLMCAVAAGVAGCAKEPPAMAPPKPPEVVIDRPVVQEVTDHEEFTGKTEAAMTVEVRPRVTGFLEKANFQEGADVRKGDPLYEMDARPFKTAVDEAEAEVARLKAQLELAVTEATRADALRTRGGISVEEYSQKLAARDMTRAALDKAQAALRSARIQLEFCTIRSPIDGRISRRWVDPGNTVKANETTLTLVVSHDVFAYFDIDERTHLRIKEFLGRKHLSAGEQKAVRVRLGLADEDGFPHEGAINFVDNRVDPGTGSVWVRAVFTKPPKRLDPGLFVRVQVPVSDPHRAILIPERALGTDQGQKFVYVLNDKNEAIYRRVELGGQHGQLREVKKGIEPTDRVVVSGLQRVRPNAEVKPREEKANGEGK